MTDDSATLRAELLPCPFCGPGQSQVELWFDDLPQRWRVGCGRCGASTGTHPRDKTEAPAIARWNTRASQSSWAKEKAELERQRDEYKAAWEQLSVAKRHASRPVTAKE